MTTPKSEDPAERYRLARAVLVMAADGGMPDTFWLQDTRIELACEVLGWPAVEARAWARQQHEEKLQRKWSDSDPTEAEEIGAIVARQEARYLDESQIEVEGFDYGPQFDEEGDEPDPNQPGVGGHRRTELTLLGTTDAMVWATEFCRIFAGRKVVGADDEELDSPVDVVDAGTMVAWFAPAIETGRNAG